jgi:CNT family concentrative nucleoside transporter
MQVLVSLLGIALLLAAGFLLSRHRSEIRWRTVGGAFAIQVIVGAFVLWVPWGKDFLIWITSGVNAVIEAGRQGSEFVFGSLSTGPDSIGFIFAFRVLPAIIFFSSLIAVLYHLKIMGFVIRIIGGAVQKLLGTSRAESFSAAANIFVGQTEAPLVVRPYIARMTKSELFAVMVGGLASVAGSILVGYVELGKEAGGVIELKYLLAACFMAAPGGLLFAKLIVPETDTPNNQVVTQEDGEEPVNVLDAAAVGASNGVKLALNVGAMLLAFIGLIAVLNLLLSTAGSWFGNPDLSLELILGWCFAPLAWIIGIPWGEALVGGSFIGKKLIVNEFVAYGDYVGVAGELSERTQAIITFALCGFANLSSIAILIGGLGSMAPSRRQEIARLGLLAVAAGTLSNLMSATIAGLFLGF